MHTAYFFLVLFVAIAALVMASVNLARQQQHRCKEHRQAVPPATRSLMTGVRGCAKWKAGLPNWTMQFSAEAAGGPFNSSIPAALGGNPVFESLSLNGNRSFGYGDCVLKAYKNGLLSGVSILRPGVYHLDLEIGGVIQNYLAPVFLILQASLTNTNPKVLLGGASTFSPGGHIQGSGNFEVKTAPAVLTFDVATISESPVALTCYNWLISVTLLSS